jgi:predicted transglutaminase-like cysteine proteinase
MQRRLLYAACATLIAAALPASAHAATLGSLPLALAAAASLEQGQCARAALPAAGETRAVPPIAMSKASAILGGQVSRLELMRREQAGTASPALPGAGLVPRSGGECALFVRPQSEIAALRPGRGGENFLASKRLAVSRTGFDAQWDRVRKGRLTVAGLSSDAPGLATLAAINSWANARIRYVEDRQLYGKADYWADARTTLKRGAGDCEDIAVLKLALLAGAGVRREDIYLTVARDLARNADHALLVVKTEGRFWLLDNNTDRLLDASEAHDYRPILSYSARGKWLHGY